METLIGKELKSLKIEENSLIIELISSEIFVVKCADSEQFESLQPKIQGILLEEFEEIHTRCSRIDVHSAPKVIKELNFVEASYMPSVEIKTENTYKTFWERANRSKGRLKPTIWQKREDGTLLKHE